MNKLILFAFIFTFPQVVLAKRVRQDLSARDKADLSKRAEFARECEYNRELLKPNYNIQCEFNYHHYNSSAYRQRYSKQKALRNKKIKIAEFNALHPGMSKTQFKDYKKVAEIINKFDVVGVTELIPLVANDFKNNLAVVDFLKETPDEIKELNLSLRKLKEAQAKRHSVLRARQIILIRKKKLQLRSDLKKASSIYRAPGYLKILTELRKLKDGKDWALIIAPRGEAAATSTTTELVGYYYRSSIVKPKTNTYCRAIRKYGSASPLACIIEMSESDLGEDKSHVFSRRPFLAEFISGRFSFVLVTSHVIFDSPKDENLMYRIIKSAFGVNSYQDLGVGVQKGNYARFSEVKVTLDFIQKLANKKKRKDIIFMGDFNLESDNKFWPQVLKSWRGSKLYITEKTSTNQARYHSDGVPTNAVSSNYDHFIFNPKVTKECVSQKGKITGGAYNFQKNDFQKSIDRIYKVRNKNESSRGEYSVNQLKYDHVFEQFLAPYLNPKSNELLTIGKVVHSHAGKHRMISKGIVPAKKRNRFLCEFFSRKSYGLTT
jgi:hypothetical protein